MKKLILVFFLLLAFNGFSQKAFPSAEGPGSTTTTGGRGGVVLHVTTLADDMSGGTFREALLDNPTTTRTIVFDVSGTIVLNPIYGSWIDANVQNVTIAGQTAPQGGITIQGAAVYLNQSHNVIIRYIRFVNTSYFTPTLNGTQWLSGLAAGGSTKFIIDHCSFRYNWKSLAFATKDDGGNFVGDITIQRSLIGDNVTGLILGGSTDSALADNCGPQSAHHNLFVHVPWRFPNSTGNDVVMEVENVVYNYTQRLNRYHNSSKNVSINNTYKAGPTTWESGGEPYNIARHWIRNDAPPQLPTVYFSGNRIIATDTTSTYNYAKTDTDIQGLFVWNGPLWSDITEVTTAQETSVRVYTPYTDPLNAPITQLGTDEAYASVLSDVGANAYLNADGTKGFYIDVMDQNYIDDVTNGTIWSGGTDHVNKTDQSALIYPTLPTSTRGASYDTDSDGIPDVWETATFGDLTRDGTLDYDADGYTDLEEFLNLVDGDIIADTENPTQPTGLVASNTGTTYTTISWVASSDNYGIASYKFYEGANLLSTVTGGVVYNVTGLSPGTGYNFTVKAIDGAGNESPLSTALQVTTQQAVIPLTPRIRTSKKLILMR